jgi:predicted acylesterase/phospholipase RssA
MGRISFFVSGLLLLLLGACAHLPPPPIAGCRLTAYPLLVSPNHPKGMGAPPSVGEVLDAVLSTQAGPDAKGLPAVPQVLVLSGGSQHGAFGAGFFRGLGTVPTYKVVTGVSTGALQSTFLFLANQRVPTDRHYPPYMLGHDPAPGHSNVDDLFLAYGISKEADLVDIGGFGEIGGVIRGSIGVFGPLRRVTAGLISDETIAEVADEGRNHGRLLLVGVADVTDGQGYAIDLTELAGRLRTGEMTAPQIRACYVDAIAASASVPLAVPPVTLETKIANGVARDLYIDGGARFGVFWEQLRKVTNTSKPADIAVIVNGSLYSDPWLKNGQKVGKWSAITLGLRSVDLLENQVYRFSLDEVERSATSGGSFRLAFISNENLPGDVAPDDFPYQGQSCSTWSAQDDRTSKPTQFHPFYMHCLLAYGEHRGAAQMWNLKLPAGP